MKNIILIGLVVLSLSAWSQEIIFQPAYKPDHVYYTTMQTDSKAEISFSGAKELLEEIKNRGIVIPMVMTGSSKVTTTTTTGAMKGDLTFPARIVYNVTSEQIVNGKETTEENPMNGLVAEGFYNQHNNLTIDTMISSRMDEYTRQLIKTTIEEMEQRIQFPDYPLSVGDSFQQTLPLQIPIAGFSPINTKLNTTYLLKAVVNGMAKLDIVYDITFNMQDDQTIVSSSGGGGGSAEFDLDKNVINKYESELSMTMTMKFANLDLIMDAKIKSKSSMSVTVE